MKQLTIQEWFTRAVAAGLMPDYDDVLAESWRSDNNDTWYWSLICNNGEIINLESMDIIASKRESIKLRKDGKDLYSLEWRKPAEEDVGKICWFWNIEDELLSLGLKGIQSSDEYMYLLADHEQIAPDEEAFKKVYGA